jgi:hypothetical protein
MTDRLAEKADNREIEKVIPQRVDEVYRTLLTQLNGLHKELGKTITKEEFYGQLATKVSPKRISLFLNWLIFL